MEPRTPPDPMPAIVALCVVGIALRLTGLDVQSLWYDEAATLHVALADDLVGTLRGDRHPPLTYFLFRAWAAVFGEADAALRALPALASSAALSVFAAVSGRLVSGPFARAGAVALYALSPFLIWHAQEVRMYAFVELGTVVALAAALRWLDTGRGRAGAVGVVLGVAVAAGSHYLGALAVVVVASAALTSPPAGARRRVMVGVAAVVGFVVWLPWIVAVLPDQLQTAWGHQQRAGMRDLAELPVRLFLVEISAAPRVGYLAAIAATAVALGAVALQAVRWILGSAPWRERRTLAMAVLPVVVAFAPGLFGVLNFAPKYLIAAAPPMLAAFAAGVAAFPVRWVRVSALGVLVVSAVGLLAVHRAGNLREDYRSACFELEESWQPGDVVVAISGTPEGFSQAPLRHYLRDRPDILDAIVPAAEVLRRPHELVHGGVRLHVVHRTAPYADPALAALRAALDTEFEGPDRERIHYERLVD